MTRDSFANMMSEHLDELENKGLIDQNKSNCLYGPTKIVEVLAHEYKKRLKYTRSKNDIIFYGNQAHIIIMNSNKKEIARAIVDVNDLELVAGHKWYLHNKGYAVALIGRSQQILMHRVIMQPPDDMQVDHIDGNTLDNRRCNMRICTNQQNSWNSCNRKDNRTGVRGVSFEPKYGRWRSRIQVNGKHIHLGYFDSIEEAIQARKEAEVKHFKEFRRK